MTNIGRYRIIGELGRGAMGIVYHAVDPAIGRSVAIKTIRILDIHDTQQREKLRVRLFREARSAGVLSHPNIVTIYDMDEADGLAYIAMAFVNGPTLEKILGSDQPLSGAVMLRVLRQTAAGLDYAHSKGIVHRDIKPANIMTDEDGAVKITDFGIAKLTTGVHTETKTISGTPNYMSPEQVQGQGIDGRTDQFSLAVIAYEILTGERPFVGEALGTVVYKIVADDPAPAHRLNGTLTNQIDSVLRKALAKKPDDRFTTCTEFVSALEKACAESRGWTTVAANTGAMLPTMPVLNPAAALGQETTDVEIDHVAPPVNRSQRKVPALLIPALMSVIVVGGIVSVVAYQVGWKPTPAKAEPPAVSSTPTATPKPNPISAEPQPVPDDALANDSPPTATKPVTSPDPVPEDRADPGLAAKPIVSPPPLIRNEPTRIQQDLWVSSNPAGAKAVLDDNFSQACQTPCTLKAPSGRHRVMVSLGGFISETREVNVGDNAIDVPPVTLRQPNGSVIVISTPNGASLRVDGRLIQQRTPATLSLTPGDHLVSVERDGHAFEKRFDIQAGSLKPWTVNFQQ